MNKKAITLLLIANAISGVAQGMSMIAIPWYFAQKNELSYFLISYLIATLISIFWVPISGSIIDKYDRKKVFLYVTCIVGACIAMISMLGVYWGDLPIILVAAVFIITFLNYNIHYPCLYAFVQEITEKHKYARMTSLIEIIGQFTTIIAGAGATLLLEGTEDGVLNFFGIPVNIGLDILPWKIHEIFVLDGITYFLGFLIISAISYTAISERSTEEGSLKERLYTGVNFLKKERPVFWFGLLSYIVFVAVLLEAFYLGVSYVKNHLLESGDIYANSKMTYSLGAIAIGLIIRHLFKIMNIPQVVILLTLATAAMFLTLSMTASIYVLFTMMLIMGMTNAGIRIARITYLFKNVPNQLFGRVSSVLFLWTIFLRVLLILIFALPFFQLSNNIIFAYRIIGALLIGTSVLLILNYRSFDLSLNKQ